MEAEAQTQHEYIEGPEDLLVELEQVDSLVEMYSKQLSEDAADADEYLNTPVAELGEEDEENDAPPTERPKRCKLADLGPTPALPLNRKYGPVRQTVAAEASKTPV
ncbi:hypothetical protein ABBQ32_009557 [Trebouxia sp. C0010 RCD-2024]